MEDKVKSKANQATGVAREKLGDVTGDEKMQQEGREQHARGDAQEAVGKARDKAKDAVDSAAGKLKDVVDG